MKNEEIEAVEHIDFVYTSANRILHWIRAFVITGLAVTGFYIASPFLSPGESSDKLVYAEWVFWHVLLGFVFLSAGILRIFLFFFGKDSSRELHSFQDFFSVKSWITQLKSYFFIGELKKKGIYGPLQFFSYMMVMVMVVLASITGLVLYVHIFHSGIGGFLYDFMRSIEALMGGLATVRLIHHITMWGFLIFIPIHVYMVVWSAIRFKHGGVDIMFTGYDYHLVKDKKKEDK
jgi:Ni/Fe-hydrogenase 1 B-type cytochrome subunit